MNLLQRRRLKSLTSVVYEKAQTSPPDSYGTDSYGTDRYDTAQYGADQYGADQYGADEEANDWDEAADSGQRWLPQGEGYWDETVEEQNSWPPSRGGAEPAGKPKVRPWQKTAAAVSERMRVEPQEGRWRLRLAPSSPVMLLACLAIVLMGALVVGWQVWQSYHESALDFGQVGAAPGQKLAAADLGAPGVALAKDKTGQGSTNAACLSGDTAQCLPAADAKDGPPGGGAAARSVPVLLYPGAGGEELVVYVSGQVNQPGVVHVLPGARVDDALRAAGGVKPNADLNTLNLARLVQDGEQIHVLAPGETPPPGVSSPAGPSGLAGGAGGSGAGAGPGTGGAGGGGAGGLVNLNTADAGQLQTLSGIGPALAQRIIEYRQSSGPFKSVQQLDEVSGIGPKLLQRLVPHCTV